MKDLLCRVKCGRRIGYGIKKPDGIYPYTLTKREKQMEAETGWPRKLPDVYPGPKWPEE